MTDHADVIAARFLAVLGVLFGALSVFAGTRVLAGIDQPGYVVLRWLVLYNVAAGLVGVGAGAGLWGLHVWALRLALALGVVHGVVLVSLLAWWAAGGAVAPDSLLAMLLRTTVWTSIALLSARVQARGDRAFRTGSRC